MGNQPSRQVSDQQRKMEQNILSHVQMTEESTPQKTWIASEKTVEDLSVLMREDMGWDRILRSFLRKITSKYQYQKYLRAVLEQILEWGYRDIGQSSSKTDQIRREATQNSKEEANQQQNNQIRKQANNQHPPTQQTTLMSLFHQYKTLLQTSYLIPWQQSLQHQSPIQQLLLPLLPQPLPQLMLSQLFAFPSVKQKHMDELFVELNLKAFSSMRELARLIVEEFVVVEDQFALEKFVVGKEVMDRALAYAEISGKMLGEHERATVYEEIKRLKQDSLKPYIDMCRQFINYKNVHCASLILQNLIVKGYHLTQPHLSFYFYISIYQIFLYQLNYTKSTLLNPGNINHHHQPTKPSNKQSITPAPINPPTLHPSFICFPQLQHLNYDKIIELFLLLRPYNQLQLIKKCFQTTLGLYQPEKGTSLFLLSLKQYVFSQKCHLSTAVECLRGDLRQLAEEAKGYLEQKMVDKLAGQAMGDLLQYERHIIEILKVYRFGKEKMQLIRTIFKVINILNKFQVTAKINDLLQLLHQGRTSYNQPHPHPIKPQPHTPQELQFLSLIMIKKVITKFLTLSQSRQQIVFIVQDKFQSQSFQYSTKEIQSLFILTEYLHKDLFRPYVPLSQLHQLLFQHMLHFGKYAEVETMLKGENLSRYSIQPEVVKMIIGESVRELLIKSEKSISVISQDVKKHIKLLQGMIGSQQRQQHQDSRQGQSHFQQSKAQQLQQLQSIRSLFKLLTKLDFYSVSLHQQQKQSISINLLYYLIQHYEHQIQVFNYDQLYRLIILIEGRHHDLVQHLMGNSVSSSTSSQTPITNEYLKFKIDLAHKAYEVGQLRFGEVVLKQVLAYQPPWISTEIIAIIKKSPQNISHDFINIAFQHCVKGQDLRFLLNLWRQRTCSPQPQTLLQKGLKQQKKLTQLFESTSSFLVLQDSYINDQKEYRNLIAQMTFNDQVLKGKDYAMFFTLMGTEVERAFYMAYQKGLDLVKLDIVLKQGMKIGVFNIANVTKIFFKLLYFSLEEDKARTGSKPSRKASYMRFKQSSLPQMLSQVQNLNSTQSLKSSLPYILLKKLHKPTLTLSLLPQPFLTNYIQSPLSLQPHPQHPQPAHTLLYKFLFDQPCREKHLIALKDQPMGKGDIRVYRQVCKVNGLNIMELAVFSLTNQLNTVSGGKVGQLLEDEKTENTIQKLVTWTESSQQQSLQLINKLTTKLFSTSTLYCILSILQSRQNPHLRETLTQQHLTILSSLSKLQVHTQFHGLITQHFFQKPINASNPKQKLSQKHTKILKKQLKLRNVFLLSKVMYFCYGMSVEVEKQVLKLFVKENQNQEERELFEQLKSKLQQYQEIR